MSAAHERRLGQAAAALAAGDHSSAERMCREVLERAPRHPRALHLAALARRGQGDSAGARELLRRSLEGDPRNLRAVEQLGAAELEAGDYAQAESWLRRAIQLGSTSASVWCWLGLALSSQDRHPEAVEYFRRAVAAEPKDPGLWLNLGNELVRIGAAADAVVSYERALQFNPAYPEAHDNLGDALLQRGDAQEAAACFRRAIMLEPENSDYHADLGNALFEQQLWDDAIASYERAVALRPDYPEALNSLGSALQEQGRPADALAPIQRAIVLRPEYAEAHDNLGNALMLLGREDEANDSFRHAIKLQPRNPGFRARFAEALLAQHVWDESSQQFRRALELKPGFADAQYGLALLQLFRQEFEQAWPGYERRIESSEYRRKNFRSKASSLILYERLRRWRGPTEAGIGEVAIWAEQGIGDEVLFSTLIPELIERNVPVLYEVDRRLLGAYQRAFPAVRFLAREDPPQEALQQASRVLAAGSLPHMFRRSRADFARQRARLLSALPERVACYRERLETLGPGLKVALSWRSTRTGWFVMKKNAPLADFGPLLKLAGARFVDVQYGDTTPEREAVEKATGVRLMRFEDVDHYNDLEGLLAILEACDLLITTCNATAHFAGVLGKRTWLLYPADRAPFHYWAHGGDHRCLWYPSVEIVSASELTDWNALAQHAASKLEQEIRAA
ncbi:MAG TPA: tetratricopeptide repeat protein [Burkholderiales bacterium]|jgi:tetratricopeptide (TPR) repeat protein